MTADPRQDDAIDQSAADSFPASDPPSHSATTRAGAAENARRDQARDTQPGAAGRDEKPAAAGRDEKSGAAGRDEDAGAAGEAIPKGTPTSHRHAHETTGERLDSNPPPERDER